MRESIRLTLVIALVWAGLAALSLPAAEGSGIKDQGSGVREQGSGIGEQGSGIKNQGSGVREQGSENPGDGGVEPQRTVPGAAEEGIVSFDAAYRLPVLTETGVERMALDEYLTGVLLAEMPVSFPTEALKAQAVACRTYTLRACTHRRHPEAAVCTDSRCCQGWRDPAQATAAERACAERAVRETDGLAIYYEGALIDATFFSCSGGKTEDAAAVWGGELPYLKAVESPGEEDAAHYTDETRVPLEVFRATLTALDGETRFPEALGGWVGSVSYTAGGGVDVMELGGRPFRGTQLRKAFGLRSTVFTLELTAEEAVFTTRGNGHRVGLSQYGAAAMARNGADYTEILTWYYTGVELRPAEA